jgi:hypothetical protein
LAPISTVQTASSNAFSACGSSVVQAITPGSASQRSSMGASAKVAWRMTSVASPERVTIGGHATLDCVAIGSGRLR